MTSEPLTTDQCPYGPDALTDGEYLTIAEWLGEPYFEHKRGVCTMDGEAVVGVEGNDLLRAIVQRIRRASNDLLAGIASDTSPQSSKQLCKHDWVGDDNCAYCRADLLHAALIAARDYILDNGDERTMAPIIQRIDDATAGLPVETGGESDPPTDGQLLDVLEEAFSNQENGYVEQNVGLRKALATLCVRFNRNADTWRAKKRVADTCPHCGQEPCGCDDPRSFV